MRLRGLPRELNCGNVDLIPSRTCEFSDSFQTCVSCNSTYLTYLRLDCCHVHCECCSVFYDCSASSDQFQVHCTVCNEPRLARTESTSLYHVYLAKFECPCGEEGHLHHLSKHRRSCRRLLRAGVTELGSPPSSSSLSGASGESSDDKKNFEELPKPFEFVVKGYIAQELNRMKEDVLNTTRVERQSSEQALQTLQDRVRILESRVNVNTGMQNRLDALERALEPPGGHVDSWQERVEYLSRAVARIEERQPERDYGLFSDSSSHQIQEVLSESVRLQSRCKFLWFDVKSLLRAFNRNRAPTETADRTAMIAGYPCKVHLQIDDDSGTKMLAAYIGIDDARPSSATWPMKRRFTLKVFDHRCTPEFENYFQTTEHSTREYFKGPGSRGCGTYYGVDLCSVEELTALNVYQRCNGMICVAIEVDPL